MLLTRSEAEVAILQQFLELAQVLRYPLASAPNSQTFELSMDRPMVNQALTVSDTWVLVLETRSGFEIS